MQNRIFEKRLAAASFGVAACLAFVALLISQEHEIEAGVIMTIAQFLMLTASIIGVDYKFNHGESSGSIHT